MAATRGAGQGAPGEKNGRAAKGRRRDREVLTAATTVFYRRGYADATVQDVADALGMLKGSLYYYIKSKEELLYRLANEVHDDVDALMSDVIALEGLSALERIQEFVGRQVEYNARNLEAISVYHHDVHHLSKPLHREIAERRRIHEGVLVSLIEQAQQEGDVDPNINTHIVSQSIFGTIIWIYRWYRPSRGITVAALKESCLDFIISGLTGVPLSARQSAG
jgi:TetR/AcrR family transcriptional regulator, cholesterol catabolism regulator